MARKVKLICNEATVAGFPNDVLMFNYQRVHDSLFMWELTGAKYSIEGAKKSDPFVKQFKYESNCYQVLKKEAQKRNLVR
jgi:hypothetical protein